MEETLFFENLTQRSLAKEEIPPQEALRILDDHTLPLLPLLHAAFRVRFHHFGRKVRVHILHNSQNGYCSEDCNYCAQAANSKAPIQKYSLKPEEEIIKEAEKACASGAYRYCMVLSGRELSSERAEHMAGLIRKIKDRYPIEVCLSAGFIDENVADILKKAGLNRYNHNLNSSDKFYDKICSSHGYQDRLRTLQSARNVDLEVCSGLIIGMGESSEDIVSVAKELRRLDARSIPVNFYMSIPGTTLKIDNQLTPEFCLRTLALFRFINPDAEIRAAGGREIHLRSLEPLALYPANS
ncbi:biotin synthase BioB, partial [Magnetococcales bacterium HHB-1]